MAVCLLVLLVVTSLTMQAPSVNTQLVCDAGTTKITPPNYYWYDTPGWCASAVGQLGTDYDNLTYRRECQRWLGGPLPDRVMQAQLTYCYEFPNGTSLYRMGICCHGTTTEVRCFNGTVSGSRSDYFNNYYDTDNWNYILNYEGTVVSRNADEVCQTRVTFYWTNATFDSLTFSKGCVPAADCTGVNAAGLCTNCRVPIPSCAQCCNSTFCNYNIQNRYDYFSLRPKNQCQPCESAACQNGAICENYASPVYNTSYTCRCRIAYTGPICADNRSECLISPNPCLNGGTCYDYSDLGQGQFHCECQPGYVGDRCELRGNLTCNNSNYQYPSWSNRNRYYYSNCTQLASNMRGHPEKVAGDGQCSSMLGAFYRVEFEVKHCSQGDYYTWATFSICCYSRSECLVSPNPCLNGGTCYDYSDFGPGQFHCDCQPGYVGDTCELRGNLTCNNSNYYAPRWEKNNYYKWNCTRLANKMRGHPEKVAGDDRCRFMLGAFYRFEFEVKHCSQNYYTWASFGICCYKRSLCSFATNPCLNGGTCYDYSDKAPGDYGCDCVPGFVGDNCEIRNHLTCSNIGSTDPSYVQLDGFVINSNCTSYEQQVHINLRYSNSCMISRICRYRSRLINAVDGHYFVQGVDGQIGPNMLQFDMNTCNRHDYYRYATRGICCPTCLSSPCQNGGYCLQIDYATYVCKCTFGYGGTLCENRHNHGTLETAALSHLLLKHLNSSHTRND